MKKLSSRISCVIASTVTICLMSSCGMLSTKKTNLQQTSNSQINTMKSDFNMDFDPTISLVGLQNYQRFFEAFHRATIAASNSNDNATLFLLKRDADPYVLKYLNVIVSEYKNIKNSMKEAPASTALYYACDISAKYKNEQMYSSCIDLLGRLTAETAFLTYDGKVMTNGAAKDYFRKRRLSD